MKDFNVSDKSIDGNEMVRALCHAANISTKTFRRRVETLKQTKTWRDYING